MAGILGDTSLLDIDGVNDNSNTSTANGGDETDTTDTAVTTALVGETVTLSEMLGGGNTGDYSTSFACTGNNNSVNYSAGAVTATLEIHPSDTAITCTYTNTLLPPAINLAKTVVSITESPNGTFTVVYAVTAFNDGDGPGEYDIDDTFTPGNGITLVSNQATIVYFDGPGESGTVTSPFTSGGKAVDDAALASGDTDVWRVTAVFILNPAVATADDLDCDNFEDFDTDTGTANGVLGSSTDIDLTDNRACAPLPQINLAKSVVSAENTEGNTWQVVYTVTATNIGDGAGFYDLLDTFSPGGGITLIQAELTSYNGGSENDQSGTIELGTPLPQSFTNGALLVTDEPLGAGENESWTITAEFDVDFGQADDSTQCSTIENGEGSGFHNFIEGSATDPNLDDNHACDEPEDPFFEGIPTLSQYGLAIMVLLMLAMGMVGFRRFA